MQGDLMVMRRLVLLLCPFLLLLLVSAAAPSAQAPQPRHASKAAPARFTDPERRTKLATAFADVDALFRDFTERTHVPGAAWGIVIDGELAHSGSTGFREIESKAPITADTVFRIASMTKSFTAMAILSLRDDGKLSLDDPAAQYVPELRGLTYPTADSPRITIRHLLTHSEGFPEDNPWGDQQLGINSAEMAELMREGIPFSNAPGVAYEYSNYGFAILGRIVSRASGMTYNEYLSAKILRPLRMTATTLERARVPADRLAHGYRWEDETWKVEPLLPDGAFGPMGGMLTSVRDLSRYVGALLAAWPPRDDPETGPIRRSSLREMQQVSRFSGASTSRDASNAVQLNAGGYGYGLRVSQTCTFRHIVAHSGGLPGFGSQMMWLPDYGVGIIVFGNVTYTPWGRVLPGALERLARTGGLQPRVAQPSPALVAARNTVAQLVSRWDDEVAAGIAANNLFRDISSDRRRAQLDALHEKVGSCPADRDRLDTVENALRGQWTVACERGTLQVAITLAPTAPPKVQFLSVRVAPTAPPQTSSCVQ
jgi:CubicO group peptidase (beta-lactamase class C family)